MKIHKLSAYGLGAFVLTFGATLAFGQARVPYTRPPYIITPGSIQTSASGDQFMCTSTTATCEVESSASATTMTATVPAFDIGPIATPNVNDRLACFSYGPSGSKTRVMCVDDTGDVNMSRAYIGTPETANGARLHALSETTIYGPSNWTSNFSVFGRAAESGASSGGVFLAYHTIDNEGMIGSLSPVISWRPLTLSASEWKFRQNGGATPIANITGTGAFNSAAASGNQAFTCTNTGCRLSLGNTARYLVDDGTNLEFVAPVQATRVETTNTTANTAAVTVASDTQVCLDGTSCTVNLKYNSGSTRAELTYGGTQTLVVGAGGTRVTLGTFVADVAIDLPAIARFRNTATTIADSGGAGAASHTQSVYNIGVRYTCNDADGCNVTMSEVSAIDGYTMTFTNESANTVNFTDTAGVTELAGNFAMGQYDTLTLRYVNDRWVELSRSNN